jgi:sulfatase modifying factor 1
VHNSPLEMVANRLGTVVRYDVQGNPSIFVRIPKMRSKELNATLPDRVHPAFIINGVEQDSILIGQFKAAELSSEGTLYSLPNLPPRVQLGADQFLERMRAFGGGASGKTAADSGLILLLAAKMGWVPKGNNYWGVDYRDGTPYMLNKAQSVGDKRVFRGWEYECLIAHTTVAELTPEKSHRHWKRLRQLGGAPVGTYLNSADTHFNGYNTLNGSGPLSWYLGNNPGHLCDLNGNCFEQDYGYRIVRGEIQILQDNNAAHPSADLSAGSAAWKAILPNVSNDGHTLVAPGTPGTLHWTWANSKITLDTVEPTFDNEYRGTEFKNLAVNATNLPYVPAIVKELGLFPCTSDTTQGYTYIHFTVDERFPRRGGYYSNASGAGLGCVSSNGARGGADVSYGARPRLIENL